MLLKTSITTLATLALLTACGTNPVNPVQDTTPVATATPTKTHTAPTSTALARPVAILSNINGSNLSGDDYGLKLLDVSRLSGTGLAQAFSQAGVTLDPATHSVVLLAMGEQPHGAQARITALQLKEGTLYVQGTASPAPTDGDQTDEITRPFAAVAIPRMVAGTVVRSDIK
ncbi:MAG: hypothetical protein V3V20_05050 [Algisphaera sp.]